MSALEGMVRLQRWQLDERRRQLADLELLAQKLRDERHRLADEEAAEQHVAAGSREAAVAYGGFARRLIERRQKLEQSLVSVEQQVAAARDALAATYQEMKRYETVIANRASQHRKRTNRVRQAFLDELGIQAHRRKSG
ncbi:MAG TPA: flagellar FliJ family protein [Stellaceae bacterium]|nr:flagellar FliJ family protein [Stellaceae bacterium]